MSAQLAPTPALHDAVVVERRIFGERVEEGTAFWLRLRAPEIARDFLPGQFVGVKVAPAGIGAVPAASWDPLFRRPFSVMRSSGRSRRQRGEDIELLGVVIGRGTALMAALEPGQTVELLGPLGNSFFAAPPIAPEFDLEAGDKRIVIAAGGVGVAPFFGVVDWLVEAGRAADVAFAFGARTRAALCGREELESIGVRVELATDDGSMGFHGLVTDLVAQILAEEGRPPVVLSCGPEPMMEATARVAAAAGAPCLVSLENQMPCGIGACFGCVVRQPATEASPARYVRACVEGPIFPAAHLGW